MASVILPWENDAPCYGRVFVKGKGGVQSRTDGALVMATPKATIDLGSLPIGSILRLKYNNADYPHVIIQKGYNGNNDVMLSVPYKETKVEKAYNENWGVVAFSQTTSFSYLNGSYYNSFDQASQAAMTSVVVPTNLRGDREENINCKVFILSATEFGFSESYPQGTAIAYFNDETRTYLYEGTECQHFTRTVNTYAGQMNMILVDHYGRSSNSAGTNTRSIVPAITLKRTTPLFPVSNADGSYDLAT